MPKLITSQYESLCLTCEEQVLVGDRVWWEPKVGVWHHKCEAPRSLKAYVDEAFNKAKYQNLNRLKRDMGE